jgi:hypothetical protein
MGFNKRFVSRDVIETSFNSNKPLSELFKSDAFIFMDDMSYEVYKMYSNGISESNIKKYYGYKTDKSEA